MKENVVEKDRQQTIINRNNLKNNKNLLYWYEVLYKKHENILNSSKKILEIGSGTSPLKLFFPNVLTSDYLNLDYLDYCFDCHNIDKFEKIEDGSIDVVILTNVVHHLYDPILFFKALTKKLARNALVICTEPYPSIFSFIIYKLFHSEPMIFSINEPKLNSFEGPLSSSNQAIPYLIFIKEKQWSIELRKYYSWDKDSISYYTFISYFITGGISRKFYIPHFIYKIFFHLDYRLASLFPKVFASFFEICLRYKGKDS